MDEPCLIVVTPDADRPEWSELRLGGRLTVASAARLYDAARAVAASGLNVRVCCGGVEHLDVSVLQILLCLGRDLARDGRQCGVADVPESVGELFRLAGLGSVA